MKPNLPLKIIVSIIFCLGLGFLSGYYSGSAATEWYKTLNKPFFQPPSWVFGPAWTLLYVLMGIATGLIWNSKHPAKSTALMLFLFQFALNILWSPVFFKIQKPGAALIIILNLLLLLVLAMRAYRKVDSTAFKLLIPYLFWICFATCLNASIVYLN